MRPEFIKSFGRVTGCKTAIRREAYYRLTGDCSSARTVNEKEVDKRVNEFLQMEDPELIYDLRIDNEGSPEKYETFLEECQAYINGVVDTAVDDRRHDTLSTESDETTVVTHLATALSVRDLHDQITKRLPEGCSIPSIQWLRLQFWPRKKYSCDIKLFCRKTKNKVYDTI